MLRVVPTPRTPKAQSPLPSGLCGRQSVLPRQQLSQVREAPNGPNAVSYIRSDEHGLLLPSILVTCCRIVAYLVMYSDNFFLKAVVGCQKYS